MGRLFLSSCKKKLLRWILTSGVLCSIALSVLTFQFYTFLHTPVSIEESGYVLVVAPGTSAKGIAQQLSNDCILQSPKWFLLWVYSQGAWNKLKAGEYLLKPGTTVIDLVHQLQEGRVIQHTFTIVPGWNFERLMLELNRSSVMLHKLVGLSDEEIMTALGHPGEHPEGQFFPETYCFPAGTTDIAFLQRAYNLLQKKLAVVWKDHQEGLPFQSPYEALILASIIEKESREADEYAEIAGVYKRRLEKKMPLQADPTVIYGAGKGFAGTIDSLLLKKATRYNTYQNIGLPPTPIALPSIQALEAAVHPKAGETLYFVANEKGKGHIFSKTLQEHHIAVRQYKKALLGAR